MDLENLYIIKNIIDSSLEQADLETLDEINFREASDPEISIIIPVYNNLKYTLNCLKSLNKTKDVSLEVILIDDASTDGSTSTLRKIIGVKLIENIENMGFIRSSNIGAKSSNGKYILLLNNDTIVVDNWLKPLMELIKRDGVGAVGSMLVYPDGKLQEAGGIIWNDGSGFLYGCGDDPNRPEYNFVREVDYCSGAALLVRNDLFRELGGLDDRYSPAYYEDTDLCFALRRLGYKVLFQPKSMVIHFGGVSGGNDITKGIKKFQEINKSKFLSKWKDVLERDHYSPSNENLFLARTRNSGKNILVLDETVPTPDRDSGSLRMYNIIKILIDIGYSVTFIAEDSKKIEPYVSRLQQYGVEVIYSPYIKSIEKCLSKNGQFFDFVILSRAHVAENYLPLVKKYCNKSKIIYDTVDLHFIRETRRAKIENNEQVLRDAELLKKLETELADASDVTLVVSAVEKNILLKENPSLRVEVVSNIHDVQSCDVPFDSRKDILFVGNFKHLPNIDAIIWFAKEIFPRVREYIPNIKLYIVGNAPTQEVESLGRNDIIVTGYVENIQEYFLNCRVFVAPLRYGAGVKGKINQSMSYGLPVVTTTIGAEGMGLTNEKDALITDDPEMFALYVTNLYNDKDLWMKLSENSMKIIAENYSYRSNLDRIRKILDSNPA
jgi:GT2 family glycosyltransferase/glycosyltransferase involved in cell wall biosynthesis